MRELIHTVLELENWNRRATCYFCYGSNNKAVCQIRSRSKLTDKIVANACACESCKEKFENDELPKCSDCGRLQIKANIDVLTGKYICDCVRRQENTQEKELPILPHERRPGAFYERQINGLREELDTAEVEIDTHLEALEIAKDWHKRQKQELLDRIKKLEAEIERLKKLTSQELVNKLATYEAENEQLKIKLAQLTSQQTSQVEVKKWPWSKIKK